MDGVSIEESGGLKPPVNEVVASNYADLTLEEYLSQDREAITLSPSQTELLEKAQNEGVPLLSLPWPVALEVLNFMAISGDKFDVSGIIRSIQDTFSEISGDMWDKYIDYLQQEADRRKDYMNSVDYQHFLENQSPAYIATVQREDGLRTNLIDAASTYAANPDNRTSAIGYGAFLLAAISIPAIAAAGTIGQVPITAAEVASVLPTTLQDPVLLVVNLFVQMAALPTAAQTAMLGVGGGKQPHELAKENARNFAQAILKILGEGKSQVEEMMQAMIGRIKGVETGAILAKIILISPALAQLYNTGVGWNAGDEFLKVLKGFPDFEGQGSEEATLAGLLRGYMSMLSPEMRSKTEAALHSYFSKKPSLKELSRPLNVMSSVFETKQGGNLAV